MRIKRDTIYILTVFGTYIVLILFMARHQSPCLLVLPLCVSYITYILDLLALQLASLKCLTTGPLSLINKPRSSDDTRRNRAELGNWHCQRVSRGRLLRVVKRPLWEVRNMGSFTITSPCNKPGDFAVWI